MPSDVRRQARAYTASETSCMPAASAARSTLARCTHCVLSSAVLQAAPLCTAGSVLTTKGFDLQQATVGPALHSTALLRAVLAANRVPYNEGI